ncbi:HDOD domain-containing protein [Rubrivivax albus]|uniref:HDOD domain-containing protein n=1 Tax=Rubrivivax albus TaxID=2499835 RepID=A0A437JXD0_9BURK|nr:HDOD domain-containing protein [Rubrivivax albus]RVT52334.1 HDOD domain-containing protein [Rubrivivax albus]
MTLPPPPFLTRPERDLRGWMARFDPDALPVLAETAVMLETWRANEDAVDAHLMTQTIVRDPLMTLKLFAQVARTTRRRSWDDARGDAETVTAALVMLGIGPFFRHFGPQAVAESWLCTTPGALDGFMAVLERSRRAAAFALAFAVHRLDHDAAVLHEAALLHDFAELLLWLQAPTLAQAVAHRLRTEPGLRSLQAQQELLNIALPDLQHALMEAWRLPSLLVRATDDRHLEDPQVRNVTLAIRVARHSAHGWDDAALPDDVRDIADFLHLSEEPTRRLLHEIDTADVD